MSTLRLPKITAKDDSGKLIQIHSYLYQLVEQLNWALDTIDTGGTTSQQIVSAQTGGALKDEAEAQKSFAAIKSLIIKSADIVEAYYQEINTRLEGIYVAQSDFGTYQQETSLNFEATSSAITETFNNLQTLQVLIDDVNSSLASQIDDLRTIVANAYIKTGLLEEAQEGIPIYGLEIGEKIVEDGVETFNKFARFTSDRISFYDQNSTEIAYISDYKLYIYEAEFLGRIKIGNYRLDSTDGLAFIWIGG